MFKHVECPNTADGHVKPVYTYDGLGTVSCMSVGCVFNDDVVCIVVLSAEAKCTILAVEEGELVKVMEASVNWSVSNCILKDVNGDGAVELILSNSRENGSEVFSEVNGYLVDRSSGLQRILHWTVPEDIISISTCILPGPEPGQDVHAMLVGFSIGGFATLGLDGSFVQNQISSGSTEQATDGKGFAEQAPLEYHDYVVYINSPTLVLGEIKRSSQYKSSSVQKTDEFHGTVEDEDREDRNIDQDKSDEPSHKTNDNDDAKMMTEKGLIAICGLGGLLRLERMECTALPPKDASFQVSNQLVWQESLSTQLFALNAVDITGDNREEIGKLVFMSNELLLYGVKWSSLC